MKDDDTIDIERRHNWHERHTHFAALCKQGDFSALRDFGLEGIDLKYDGNIFLMNAIAAGSLEIVEYLLSNGASPHHIKYKSLRAALQFKQFDIFKAQFNYVEKIDSSLMVSLIVNASLSGCEEAVDYLFENIKKVDGDLNYNHLMSRAGSSGQISLIERLINAGYDVNMGNGAALMGAVNGGQKETVRYLFNKKAAPNIRDGAITTQAFKLANKKVCKFFIQNKADLNSTDSEVLKLIVQKGDAELLQMALDAGASISSNNLDELTYAVRMGRLEMVDVFLNHPDIDLYQGGDILLKTVLKRESAKLLQKFFDAGLDPTEFEGLTPTGYDWQTLDQDVEECLHYYYTKGDYKKQPAKAKNDQDSALVFAARSNNFTACIEQSSAPLSFEQLLEKDRYKNTVLEILASRGRLAEIMRTGLWSGREKEAVRFFEKTLRGKIPPRYKQEYTVLKQNLMIAGYQTAQNTGRVHIKRRVKKV